MQNKAKKKKKKEYKRLKILIKRKLKVKRRDTIGAKAGKQKEKKIERHK